MAGKAIYAGEKAKEAGKEEIAGGMQKMSGRDSEGQKGFRSE